MDDPQALVTERPIRRIRRENLARLVAEFDSARELAAKTETVDTHLTAIKNGRRSMGDDLAQKLEVGAGKPFGWMDVEHCDTRIVDLGPAARAKPSSLIKQEG